MPARLAIIAHAESDQLADATGGVRQRAENGDRADPAQRYLVPLPPFTAGRLFDRWRLSLDGRLLWRDATVDVVIPAFNEDSNIPLRLAALARQTRKPTRIIL